MSELISMFFLTERSQRLQDLLKLKVEVQILLKITLLVIPKKIVLSHDCILNSYLISLYVCHVYETDELLVKKIIMFT